MTNLFDAVEMAAIRRRIGALEPDRKAQWGRMDAAQMLAHCQVPLEVALGTRTLKRNLIGLLFGRAAKKKLLAPRPFEKDLPTAPSFRVRDRRDFVRERDQLFALLERFERGGPAALTQQPHPFFGPLTVDEWSTLQWKHLDHHLRQFGV